MRSSPLSWPGAESSQSEPTGPPLHASLTGGLAVCLSSAPWLTSPADEPPQPSYPLPSPWCPSLHTPGPAASAGRACPGTEQPSSCSSPQHTPLRPTQPRLGKKPGRHCPGTFPAAHKHLICTQKVLTAAWKRRNRELGGNPQTGTPGHCPVQAGGTTQGRQRVQVQSR